MRRLCLLTLAIATVHLVGCMTHADRLRQVRTAFYAGDLATAEDLIDRGLKKDDRDADVLRLEKTIIQLADGQPHEAEATLRDLRDRFDYLEQTSAVESALVVLTEDDSRAYAGEDYEKVLIRALLAISNLMQGGDDAEAYSLQIADKQQQIIDGALDAEGTNPKASYQQVALGPYLRGALREETHHDYDDAARNWAMVVNWQPDFRPGQQDLDRALHGHHSEPGNGVLYIFAFVGRGPYKEEVAEMPTTAAMLIADRILSSTMNQELPPTIAPLKIPRLVGSRTLVSTVDVRVARQSVGQTQTITDVSRMAIQQFDAVYPQIMARAVVRRVVKKGMIYGAKEALGVEKGSIETLPLDLAGIAWEATENADTRCWGLLPDKIQVLRVELPAGSHEIALQPMDPSNHYVGPSVTQSVQIANGRNTYMLLNAPDQKIVGRVLTSGEQSAESREQNTPSQRDG